MGRCNSSDRLRKRIPLQLHTIIWLTLMWTGVVYAFWRGGWPERTFAAMLVIGSAASGFSQNIANQTHIQFGIMTVDIVFLIGCVALAMLTDRWWTLFIVAFQLIEVITHSVMLLDQGINGLTYLRGIVIWSYLSLGALYVGTWQYQRWKMIGGQT